VPTAPLKKSVTNAAAAEPSTVIVAVVPSDVKLAAMGSE
jgi:hypothetical protein